MRCPVAIGDGQLGHGALRRGEAFCSLAFTRRPEQGVGADLMQPEAAHVECQQPDQQNEDDAPAKGIGDKTEPESARRHPAHPRATAGTNM